MSVDEHLQSVGVLRGHLGAAIRAGGHGSAGVQQMPLAIGVADRCGRLLRVVRVDLLH